MISRTLRVVTLNLLTAPAMLMCAAMSLPRTVHAAEPIAIVVGGIVGADDPDAASRLEDSLDVLGNVTLLPRQDFLDQASNMRILELLPADERAVREICSFMYLDALVFGKMSEPDPSTWHRAQANDRILRLGVWSCIDGLLIDEFQTPIRNGAINPRSWGRIARGLYPILKESVDFSSPNNTRSRPREPRVADPFPSTDAPADEFRQPIETTSPRMRRPTLSIYGGFLALNRSFAYSAAPESRTLKEGGIAYDLAFVPGFHIDAEIYPFANADASPIPGLGIAVRFEKVFLRTLQTVIKDEGEEKALLETNHWQGGGAFIYRYFFPDGGFELITRIGFSHMAFMIAENEEYNGVEYNYLDLGLGGFLPLGLPWLGIEVNGGYFPIVSLGSSVEEVAAEESTVGFELTGGLTGRFESGFTLRVAMELKGFESALSGEGRNGRVGEAASDRYLGLRALGGFRF